jgi:hypothetical protein
MLAQRFERALSGRYRKKPSISRVRRWHHKLVSESSVNTSEIDLNNQFRISERWYVSVYILSPSTKYIPLNHDNTAFTWCDKYDRLAQTAFHSTRLVLTTYKSMPCGTIFTTTDFSLALKSYPNTQRAYAFPMWLFIFCTFRRRSPPRRLTSVHRKSGRRPKSHANYRNPYLHPFLIKDACELS